jgi:hypothetical protein
MDVKVFGGWPCDFSATCGLLVRCISHNPEKTCRRGSILAVFQTPLRIALK